MVVKGDGSHIDPVPPPGRRTQASRRAATRAALLTAARELFAAKGFAGAGQEEIVQRAGVTRGALYHHFESKDDLFRAVYEEVETEVMGHIAEAAMVTSDPKESLRLGALAWLEFAADPAVARICLIDAPAVLDPALRRQLAEQYGFGMVRAVLQECMDAGQITPQPVDPLARIVLAALLEAATLVGEGADRAEIAAIVEAMVDAL
jgi:AcrR family transcriptional regulator